MDALRPRRGATTISADLCGTAGAAEALAAGAELADLARQKRVALLCYERDAAVCHRSLLREAMLHDFKAIDLVP